MFFSFLKRRVFFLFLFAPCDDDIFESQIALACVLCVLCFGRVIIRWKRRYGEDKTHCVGAKTERLVSYFKIFLSLWRLIFFLEGKLSEGKTFLSLLYLRFSQLHHSEQISHTHTAGRQFSSSFHILSAASLQPFLFFTSFQGTDLKKQVCKKAKTNEKKWEN